jgi:hypothetical protein
MLDLSKIRIPAGAVRLEIDDPEYCRIKKAMGCIRGWFAAGKSVEIPETFSFRIGGIIVPHRIVHRLDVEAAMPEYTVTGFEIAYELSVFLPYIQKKRLTMHLTLADYDAAFLRFEIAESALASCVASASEG